VSRTLTINGYIATLNGPHFGNGGIIKQGNGYVILNGAETYTGNTEIHGGRLYVNNSIASGVILQHDSGISATLKGTGTIAQTVTVLNTSSGGFNNNITPGAGLGAVGDPGTLTMAGLNVTAGEVRLLFDILGTTPGTQYDQVVVTGSALLGTMTRLFINQGSFTPTIGDSFLIMVRGSGSSGILSTFGTNIPLNEGDTFSAPGSPGNFYQISYVGGDGNDISLTYVGVPEPTTWALLGITVAGAGLIGYRRRRQQQRDAEMPVL
jgi:autotransporter-associated beta strand protein